MTSPIQSRNMRDGKKRRMSVVDKFAMTERYIRDNFHRLTEIWDEVEMPEDKRYERTDLAFKHIQNLIDQLVESEEHMLEGVIDGIRDGLAKIDELCTVLELPSWETNLKNPSIALRQAVTQKVTELTTLFEEKKTEESNVRLTLGSLAGKLGEEIELEDVSEQQLMSVEQLSLWKARQVQLESELCSRTKLAKKLQCDLREWTSVLPESSDEVQLLCQVDLDAIDTVYSSSLISAMSENHSEVENIYNEWISTKTFAWVNQFEILTALWNKCHIVAIDQTFQAEFNPKECDFDAIEAEIQRLELLYSARKPIYDLLQQFKEKWNQKIELDQKRKDPNYFKCRDKGHNVTNDLKLEKSLNACVERLKTEIGEEYLSYKENHPEDSISIEGFTPVAYLEWMHEEYITLREQEKLQKQSRSKQQPSTGSPFRSPSVTPRRIEKRKAMSTLNLFKSVGREASFIQPTRNHFDGPKTSSPKKVKLEPTSSTPHRATICRTPLSTPRRF